MLVALGERRAETAGKYRLILPLGQGGSADVYLAVADGLGGFQKLVVLKILKRALAEDGELRGMFLTEARLAARLQHPNIVQTYEVIEDDGTPIIVMEFLDGQPLSQVIVRGKQGEFTLPMQVRVLADALAGLHAAHELTDVDGAPLGVVHRDVSPQNLFVTVQGQTKVLDFGIAKVQRSTIETEVGTIKGKLRYMSPEQLAGEKLDRRSDVYAAGVILWEALAGERMWKAATEAEIRARVRNGDLPALRPPGREVPAALERICRRALALAPAERHGTALELAEELEQVLEQGLPALGRPVTHREIGAMITRLFEDVRAQSRAAIEQKLGRLTAAGVPVSIERPTTETVETPIKAAPEPAPTPTPAVAPRPRRGALVALALAGAATWASLAFVGHRRPSSAGAPPSAPARTVAAATPAPAPAAGRPQTATPAPPAPPADVPPARAGAGASGHAVVRSPSRRLPRAPAAGDSAAAPRPPALAPPRPDCTYPFFVDADGIKRFRPECR